MPSRRFAPPGTQGGPRRWSCCSTRRSCQQPLFRRTAGSLHRPPGGSVGSRDRHAYRAGGRTAGGNHSASWNVLSDDEPQVRLAAGVIRHSIALTFATCGSWFWGCTPVASDMVEAMAKCLCSGSLCVLQRVNFHPMAFSPCFGIPTPIQKSMIRAHAVLPVKRRQPW